MELTEKKKQISDEKEQQEYANLTFASLAEKFHKADITKRLREANRLIHVIVTCNNPNKRTYDGDIFCVRNKFLETMKKFVPFGRETHVPKMMLDMIKSKQCQMFREETVNGHKVTKPYFIKEYTIEELPPISAETFEAIKQHQLAEGKFGA